MFCLPFLTVIPEFLSDWTELLKIMCILALGIFSVGAILRALVGRGSPLTRSISAVLNLILIYLSAAVGYVYLPGLHPWLESIPFLSLSTDHFYLLDPTSMPWGLFYSSVLRMSVLALFVNMLESWLPSGRHLLSWYGLRLFNSLSALALYLGFHALADTFMPQFFGEWAKWILLVVWGGILLIAVLKLIFSAILTVFNPILGACYTFFFSNLFGSQFSKAILTTVFSLLIIYALGQAGYAQVVFSDLTLLSYLPASLVMMVALYLFGKFL